MIFHNGLPRPYETDECSNCRRTLIANIPFIEKDCYGYKSAECPCGEGDAICSISLRDKKKGEELRRGLSGVIE